MGISIAPATEEENPSDAFYIPVGHTNCREGEGGAALPGVRPLAPDQPIVDLVRRSWPSVR